MAVPVRELLAVVLGAGLGLFMLAYPRVIVKVHAVGRRPRTPSPAGPDVDDKWLWVVRVLGVACLVVAAVIGAGML